MLNLGRITSTRTRFFLLLRLRQELVVLITVLTGGETKSYCDVSQSSHTLFLFLLNAPRVTAVEYNCLIWCIERGSDAPPCTCLLFAQFGSDRNQARGHASAARIVWQCRECSCITVGSFHACCVNRGQRCAKCHGINL